MRHPNKRRALAAKKREARAFYELRRRKREREAPPTFEKPPKTDDGRMFTIFVVALALAAIVALARIIL